MSNFAYERLEEKSPHLKKCNDCGSIINIKAEICPNCGVRQHHGHFSNQNALAGKNRVFAALFAFFLGGFGIHKFYFGKTLQGVLYILFCWTSIPFFISFVEGILYLLSSDEEFYRKHCTNS